MDENYLQSILGGPQSLSDQYSAANMQQQAPADPTAAPQPLSDQYSAANIPDAQTQPLNPPPGLNQDGNNFLQQFAQPSPNPTAAPQPDAQHPLVQAVRNIQAGAQPSGGTIAAPAPRARHSVLDILGHLADAVATVGGSKPMYQSGLDAETARQNALQDRAAAQIKAAADAHTQQLKDGETVATTASTRAGTLKTGLESSGLENAIYARALSVAQTAAKTGGDPVKAYDAAMASYGDSLPADRSAALRDQVTANPTEEGLGALSTAYTTAKDDGTFGNNLYTMRGPDGKLHYYQPNTSGAGQMIEGGAPVDKLTMHDFGGATGIIDSAGNVKKVIPNSQSPDNAANNTEKRLEDERKANKPASGKSGDDPYAMYHGARTGMKALVDGLTDLTKDPNLPSATGYIAGAVDTPARQRIQAKVAALMGQTVPVATAILKSQGVQRPAQAEVMATAKGLISDLGFGRQNTGDFINGANTAKARLAARITDMDNNALRTGVIDNKGNPVTRAPAAPRLTAPPVAPAPAKRVLPASRASVSNW